MAETLQDIKPVIHILPFAGIKRYGVTIVHSKKVRIHYETELSFLNETGRDHFSFQINRRQVYINNQEPEKLIDQLADEMGKVLYPLRVEVNSEGFVTGIMNTEEIAARWQETRERLKTYYQGRIVDNAFSAMDSALLNKKSMVELIKSDWFLSMYFSGIYGLKPYDFREFTKLPFPVLPFKPMVSYRVKREITLQHTATKCLVIQCKGAVCEERSLEDIVKGAAMPVHKAMFGNATEAKGAIAIRYILYHKDFSVRSVIAEIGFQMPDGLENNIEVEIYHLD